MAEAAEQQQDFLSMSDEEIENMAFPPEESAPAQEQPSEEPAQEEPTGQEEDVVVDEAPAQEEELIDFDPYADGAPQEQPDAEEDFYQEEEEQTQETEDEPEQEEAGPADTGLDYQSAIEELFSPFRANGKNMQVSSVEDARRLMQMGANYNKKMAALKPNLKMMKMLENNGLLSEDKINYLIDLEKKNPKAISKLIKEGNLDVMDLDEEQSDEYTPNAYNVSDKQFEFDNVVDDLRDTPSFEKTVDIIDNKWDAASKQVLLDDPNSLQIINDHVDTGIYDIVMPEVERQQMLGKLDGLSTLAAYKYIGSLMEKNGAFEQYLNKNSTTPNTQPRNPDTQPKANRQAEQQRTSRKKAAASPKNKVGGKKGVPSDFNPLNMSDEEFEKFDANFLK
jgi:hypothetical protein